MITMEQFNELEFATKHESLNIRQIIWVEREYLNYPFPGVKMAQEVPTSNGTQKHAGIYVNLYGEGHLFLDIEEHPEWLESCYFDGDGDMAPSAQAIHDKCNQIKNVLIIKNRRYGDSALHPKRVFSRADAMEQIRVRMDDKLSRIANRKDDDDEDAYMDLAGYLVLYLIARDEAKNGEAMKR